MNAIKKYLNRNEEKRISWVVANLSKLNPGSKILDAGAGEMRYRKYCNHLSYKSQDFCGYDGKGDNQGLQTQKWDTSRIDIVSDIASIPEADAAFDAILCTEVIEHVPEPTMAIKEFARLLKPGGTLILTAPFASLTHFAPFHFYSGFNRYFYQYFCDKFGFEIVEMTPNGTYLEYLEQEQARLLVDFVKKKAILSLIVGAFGFLSIKILSLFQSTKHYQNADLLCFGYQIVARKK